MDMITANIFMIIVGCIVALAEWIRLVKNDAGTMVAQIRTLETKIEHLEEEITELKKNEASIEATVHKALEERIVNEKTLALLQEKVRLNMSSVKK